MGPSGFRLVGHLLMIATISSLAESKVVGVQPFELSNSYIPVTYPYKFDMFNDTEIEELVKLEQEQLEVYETELAESRFLSDWSGGCGCKEVGIGCGCCAGVKVIRTNYEACLNVSIEAYKLALVISMDFNKKTILEIEIAPTELCAFLPLWWPFNRIQLCLVAYHLYIGPLDPQGLEDADFKICLQLDLVIFTPVFSVDFNCLVMSDGEIWIDNSITTYRPGIIALNINKGDPKLSFNNPFNAKSALLSNLPTVHVNKIKKNVEKTLDNIKKLDNPK